MEYSTYSKTTGAIIASISIEPHHAELYITDGVGIIEGSYLNAAYQPTHFVNLLTGNPNIRSKVRTAKQPATLVKASDKPVTLLTDLPDGIWLTIKPTQRMEFQEQTLRVSGQLNFALEEPGTYLIEPVGKYKSDPWTVEAISLEALMDRRTSEIDAQKANVIAAGMVWNGHRWDADDASVAALRSYLGSVPEGFFFTDYDNENVPLTSDEVDALASAMATFKFAAHARAQELKNDIRSSQTINQVMALDITVLWPA